MKKLILATLLLVTLNSLAFTGDRVNDKKLLSELRTSLKASPLLSGSNGTRNKQMQAFNFNGRVAYACFYDDDELAGFSVPLADSELPTTISAAVAKKYADWKVEEALMFIDASAYTNYYVRVIKGKANIALKVSIDGHTHIFSRM